MVQAIYQPYYLKIDSGLDHVMIKNPKELSQNSVKNTLDYFEPKYCEKTGTNIYKCEF